MNILNFIRRLFNMFNEDSKLVKIWFSAVLAGVYTKSQVPKLSNLQEEVYKKLNEIGYVEEIA